ncbi:probable ubiquitin carboxyl-terminal hydrolase MINDY-4 [Galendromus occidentalis]|uniref:Ubiquitin carboxyl-terminal hydrolase MINDY n=1 Tax=Galendromus occidentalis TaxID=34638 RepID=A0AAJ7WI79_9ACAR|nr:probable ubiquitin carboxyl-terminal hydrolase MINDY-4 [Galendromus occidentalis]
MAQQMEPSVRREALNVMFGEKVATSGELPKTWYPQKLAFHDDGEDATFFAIKQVEGGPCGCYAAIQAYILRDLLSNRNRMDSFSDRIDMRRCALASALASILWKARRYSSKNKDGPVFLVIQDDGGKWNYVQPTTMEETAEVIRANYEQISTAGVVPFTVSIILTKGIDLIKQELVVHDVFQPLVNTDSSDCTQDLVNLYLTGRACVGLHDEECPNPQSKGVLERQDIGFLSELGHQIGSFYRDPIEPFWVLNFGHHYTVLYSAADDALNNGETRNDFYWFPGFSDRRYIVFGEPGPGEFEYEPISEGEKWEYRGVLNCVRSRWTPEAKIISWRQYGPIPGTEDDGQTSSGSEK